MEERFDLIVVGAGVGGLTVAALATLEGLKTLLVEQCDRVGGRATSIRGEEILFHGVERYQKLLSTQYTWLAYTEPDIDEIISKKMLQGYTLDVGYHGVSLNGDGYFRDVDKILGTGVTMIGNVNSTYIDDEWYLDFHAGKMDDRIYKMCKEQNIPMIKFYTGSLNMKAEDFDTLEKISVTQWAKDNGLYENKTVFGMIHAVSTLITTINDPDDISIGDIFRYMATVINPRFISGKAKWPSGFAIGGIIRWSQAIANRFVELGGDLMLNTKVDQIVVQDGQAQGVTIKKNGKKQKILADKVVSNIPVQDIGKVLDWSNFPQDWASHTKDLYGYGSIAPYFGLNKLVMPEREWKLGVKDVHVIPKSEGFEYDVYMCWNIQSQIDPSCAPGGKYLMAAYAPVTEKEAKDKGLMVKACKHIIDYLERRYPGFKKSVDWALFPTCWKLEGVAKSKSQAGTLKAPVEAPGIKGLYFTGDTIKGYGVAMDCAVAAALICASRVTGKDYGVS
ncbi:MAG: FAD-dependent oxidoreductase [Thermodesulfobacteriota bacterium]|nr:FAD-dependent oxidoreductase [Thermodesulfobacteriota bacterium]